MSVIVSQTNNIRSGGCSACSRTRGQSFVKVYEIEMCSGEGKGGITTRLCPKCLRELGNQIERATK